MKRPFTSDNNPSEEGDFHLDAASFQYFVRARQKEIYNYGRRIFYDRYVIENIVQDAFLKLWDFRYEITSEEHAIGFLKQNVKWSCYRYFRSPVTRMHRSMVELDSFSGTDTLLNICDTEEELTEQDMELDDRRLHAAYQCIANLLVNKEKEVMEMYFVKGLNHAAISRYFHISIPTVTLILNKCKSKLIAVINVTENNLICPANKGTVSISKHISFDQIDGLNKEQNNIYHLRTKNKFTFEQIARKLNVSETSVKKEYVQIWRIMSLQKKEKAALGKRYCKQSGDINLLSA